MTAARSTPAPPRRPNVLLLVAAVLQIAALLTPAIRVRIVGTIAFVRVPDAGLAFAVLALFAVVVAFVPRGWWRWMPAGLTAALTAIVYARVRLSPSGTFVDPLLRHAMHPAWGFVPMAAAALLGLAGAAAASARERAVQERRDVGA